MGYYNIEIEEKEEIREAVMEIWKNCPNTWDDEDIIFEVKKGIDDIMDEIKKGISDKEFKINYTEK